MLSYLALLKKNMGWIELAKDSLYGVSIIFNKMSKKACFLILKGVLILKVGSFLHLFVIKYRIHQDNIG